MRAGGSHLQASDVERAESEAGMNQGAGLSPGSPGSGIITGPSESGEPNPKGSADDDQPEGLVTGPWTYGPSGHGHKSRTRSRSPGKREGAMSPRALSPDFTPGVGSGSGEQYLKGSASGETYLKGSARRSRCRERALSTPVMPPAANVPVSNSPFQDAAGVKRDATPSSVEDVKRHKTDEVPMEDDGDPWEGYCTIRAAPRGLQYHNPQHQRLPYAGQRPDGARIRNAVLLARVAS